VTFHEEPGVDIASFQQADESPVGAGAGAGAGGAGAGAAPGAGAGEGAPVASESPPPQAAIETANDSSASVPNRFKSFLFIMSPKCLLINLAVGLAQA